MKRWVRFSWILVMVAVMGMAVSTGSVGTMPHHDMENDHCAQSLHCPACNTLVTRPTSLDSRLALISDRLPQESFVLAQVILPPPDRPPQSSFQK